MSARANKTFLSAKDIALIAVMTALLIGGQFALSFTYGLEIVTVLLLCFSYVFGVKRGMLTATAFSLLRCFVFGFFPNIIALYLIYYNAFALVCGLCGKNQEKKRETLLLHLLFVLLLVACVAFLIFPPQVSVLKKDFVKGFFLALLAAFALAVLGYDLLFFQKEKGKKWQTALFLTAVACFSTVCFSLLDDVLTPLFYGWGKDAAYAYFLSSFLAMLPQTACSFVSVFFLFLPLTKIFTLAEKSFVKRKEV